MIIKNAEVYTKDHKFEKKDILIKDEKIERLAEPGSLCASCGGEVIDAEGMYVIPGLVDIHFHGAMGHDMCNSSKEEFEKIAEYEARNGILAICPATMSYNEEILTKVVSEAAKYDDENGADLVGINLEGPFINTDKAGAQNKDYIMPASVMMFRNLQSKCGNLIKLVDLAPEIPESMEFIKECGNEVRVSIAHTCCTYEEAREAFENGAKHMTHLYNAMPGINHRSPGPIVAGVEAGATAEIITDGIHIHPAAVRFAFRMFGADRMILISDSMEATGLEDGTYSLGGQLVKVTGKRATLAHNDAVLAGSVTNLFNCMRTAVKEMEIPLEDAVRAASENPAAAIGVGDSYGKAAEGYYANLILMDKDMNIKKLIKRGRELV
ncbi:MAG: N-acetylglucosamine-6-phosphate deacetylase [Eubacteriales bacterium]|nr:N-acetylglucosamine-6-phosphate deacetylase [Eubacteriales bacterium]